GEAAVGIVEARLRAHVREEDVEMIGVVDLERRGDRIPLLVEDPARRARSANRPRVADLPVENGGLESHAAAPGKMSFQAGRAIALPPVGVGPVAVERRVAEAAGRRERPFSLRQESRSLALPLVSGLAGEPPG